MTVGILHEPLLESRVSLLPEHIVLLKKQNINVIVETGCGKNAFASDEHYQQAGAQIVSRKEVLENSEIALSINPISIEDMQSLKKDSILIGMYNPLSQSVLVNNWTSGSICVFSLDMLPRTTRAQSMDVLSSQANIAGYRAVLMAAMHLPKYFPMFMTAAGSIAPAKVLILGAGVAGLQAIATAKRLGAVVQVFDTRPSVKEEVMS